MSHILFTNMDLLFIDLMQYGLPSMQNEYQLWNNMNLLWSIISMQVYSIWFIYFQRRIIYLGYYLMNWWNQWWPLSMYYLIECIIWHHILHFIILYYLILIYVHLPYLSGTRILLSYSSDPTVNFWAAGFKCRHLL